jgi:alpha-N-acetylglucosaminidase
MNTFRFFGVSVLFLMLFSACKRIPSYQGIPEGAVYKLLERNLGQRAGEFRITIDKSYTNPEYVIVSSDSSGPVIKGNSISSVCMGIQNFLRKTGSGHYTFHSEKTNLPDQWPVMDPDTQYSFISYRWAGSAFHEGYESFYWDWDMWENHLDRLAMHGVNVLLLTTGIQGIWNQVFLEEGISRNDLNNYYTAANFLPFQRAGKFNHIGGPPPEGYFAHSMLLMKKIHQRANELEIQIVLPSFEGFVPLALKRKFPNANIQLIRVGSTPAEDTYWLDMRDPVFQRLQQSFWGKYREYTGLTPQFSFLQYFTHFPPLEKLWNTGQKLRNMGEALTELHNSSNAPAQKIIDISGFQSNPAFWTKENIRFFLQPLLSDQLIAIEMGDNPSNTDRWKKSYMPDIPFIKVVPVNEAGSNYPEYSPRKIMDLYRLSVAKGHNIIGWGTWVNGYHANHQNLFMAYELPWVDSITSLRFWQEQYCQFTYDSCTLELLLAERILRETRETTGYLRMNRHFGAYRHLIHKFPDLQWATYKPPELLIIQLRTALDYYLHNYLLNQENPTYREDLITMANAFLGTMTDKYLANTISAYLTNQDVKKDSLLDQVLQTAELMDDLLNHSKVHHINHMYSTIDNHTGLLNYKNFLKQTAIMALTNHPLHEESDLQARFYGGLNKLFYAMRWKGFFEWLDTQPTGMIRQNEADKWIKSIESEYRLNLLQYELQPIPAESLEGTIKKLRAYITNIDRQ